MEKILEFLDHQMPKPQIYDSLSESWFQYLSVIIIILFSILAIIKMRNANDKQINKIMITASIIIWVFEIYKQIIFSYEANWNYPWYIFPFQFCSSPLYVMPLVPLLKPGKVRNSLLTFLATYAFFSGTAVVIYPATVFVSTTGINIQTMVHHGTLMVIGVGLLANSNNKKTKNFLGGSIVFACLLLIAIGLNAIHNTWIQDGTFNMFFINPKFENGLPILGLFQPLVHPIIFILIYFVGFAFVAALVFFIAQVIHKTRQEKRSLYYQHQK